jgi:hypothetical protein
MGNKITLAVFRPLALKSRSGFWIWITSMILHWERSIIFMLKHKLGIINQFIGNWSPFKEIRRLTLNFLSLWLVLGHVADCEKCFISYRKILIMLNRPKLTNRYHKDNSKILKSFNFLKCTLKCTQNVRDRKWRDLQESNLNSNKILREMCLPICYFRCWIGIRVILCPE